MGQPSQRLIADMKAVADALREIRSQLVQMTASDRIPVSAWPDASTVQVLGLDVAAALDGLAVQLAETK